MIERIVGVFKLDPQTFEEVEHDPNATAQAAQIVGVVALIGAVGGSIWALFTDGNVIGAFLSPLISTFLGWIVWSVVTYVIGTNLFGGKADVGEMLRVIGFAMAPQVLSVIPCLGQIVGGIWSLIAGFIAIRQGLDLDNAKTAFTILIGFVGYLILYAVLGSLFGLGMLG